jgi:hypothetical protein
MEDAFAALKVLIRSAETKRSFIATGALVSLVRCLEGTGGAEAVCVVRALCTQASSKESLDDVVSAIVAAGVVELLAQQLIKCKTCEHRASSAIALYKLTSNEEARLHIAKLLPPLQLTQSLEASRDSPTAARFLLGLLCATHSLPHSLHHSLSPLVSSAPPPSIWQDLHHQQVLVPLVLSVVDTHSTTAAVVQQAMELLLLLVRDGAGVASEPGLCECVLRAMTEHARDGAVQSVCCELICTICTEGGCVQDLVAQGAGVLVQSAYKHAQSAAGGTAGQKHARKQEHARKPARPWQQQRPGGTAAAEGALAALGLIVPADTEHDLPSEEQEQSSGDNSKHYAGKYQYGHGLATDGTGSMPDTACDAGKFLVGNPEKCDLNQYWYSEHTIRTMAKEVEHVMAAADRECGTRENSTRNARAALVSTPSIYFALSDACRTQSHVLEFDEQWGADRGFVFYDFNRPEDIPLELHHALDMVVVDPPFVTEEVWTKYATTAKLLLRPGGKLLCTTIAENAGMMHRLLGVDPVPFKPSIPNLVYQYLSYTNYPTKHLALPNAELGE